MKYCYAKVYSRVYTLECMYGVSNEHPTINRSTTIRTHANTNQTPLVHRRTNTTGRYRNNNEYTVGYFVCIILWYF